MSKFGTITTLVDEKTEKKVNTVSAKEISAVADKTMGATVSTAGVTGKLVGPVVSPGMTTTLELGNFSNLNPKTSPTSLNQTCTVLPSDSWL